MMKNTKVYLFTTIVLALSVTKCKAAWATNKPLNKSSPYVDYASSEACTNDVKRMLGSIKTDKWALEMVDALGKPEDSMLEGNLRWAGEFDQCHSINVPPLVIAEGTVPGFKGRYCWLSGTGLFMAKPFAFQTGGCVPDSCDSKDVLAVYPFILDALKADKKKIAGFATLDDVMCLPEETPMTYGASFTLFLFILYGIVVVGISFYDYQENYSNDEELVEGDEQLLIDSSDDYDNPSAELNGGVKFREWSKKEYSESPKPWKDLVYCFSLVRNAEALTEPCNKQLSFLNGIRIISFFAILITNAESCQRSIDRNVVKHREYVQEFTFQLLLTGHYAVETFFFISGFCFSYVFLKNGSSMTMTWKHFVNLVFNRYLRSGVPLMMIFIIQSVLTKYASNGPMWEFQEGTTAKCSTMWWSFFLQMQNFFGEIKECCGWLWYVAVDFQFHVVGLALLFVFQRSTNLGVLVCFVIMLVSNIIILVISYSNSLGTYQGYLVWSKFEMTQIDEKLKIFYDDIYNKPYCRIGTYLTGLLFGLYVFKDSSKYKLELRKGIIWLTWGISLSCFFSVLYICYYMELGYLASALYHSTARYVWCFGLIMLFQLCLNDLGGVVQDVLSCEFWTTPGRITYSAYLVHMAWLQYLFFSERQFTDYNPLNLSAVELGSLGISYALAYFFSLFFETPFVRLGKLLCYPFVPQHSKRKEAVI